MGREFTASVLTGKLDEAFAFTPQRRAAWLDLVRTLAAGRAVPETPALHGLPETEYSEEGLIVGSLVTLNPTDHQITFRGARTWTWCIFDALLVGMLGGHPIDVRTSCAATGSVIRFTVSPSGVRYLTLSPAGVAAPASPEPGDTSDPASCLVSLPQVFEPGMTLRTGFCCRARCWVHKSDAKGVGWFTLDDAFAITRAVAQRLGLIEATAPGVRGGTPGPRA